MQKHVNLVDLVKSFPTNIFLQNLASIQQRTSPIKFAHLAEKSGKGSISNLSTKAAAADGKGGPAQKKRKKRRAKKAEAPKSRSVSRQREASSDEEAKDGTDTQGYSCDYASTFP